MSIEELKSCIKVAACVCGRDGVISEAEEQKLFQMLGEKFTEFDEELFESALTEFFDSDKQIEDYLELLVDEDLRRFTLLLAETSAGADGLEITENIALEKAYMNYAAKRHA